MNSLSLLAAVIVNGGGVIALLVGLVIIGLLYWVISQFGNAKLTHLAYIISIVAAVLLVVNWLLGFGGHSFIAW